MWPWPGTFLHGDAAVRFIAGEGRSAVQPGEPDPERLHDSGPRPERRDRELLWVESVSERLLGGQAPRPWERVYFDRDADAEQQTERAPGDPGDSPAPVIEPEPSAPES